jgi:CDGSH-type Zn-finger protein
VTQVEIKATENGPNVVFVDGKVFAALCRCGNSSNKPYCDGTHMKVNFIAGPGEIKVLSS